MTRSEPKSGAAGAKPAAKPAANKSVGAADNWIPGSALPANLPDPAVLQRMATEFFTALPGFSQSAGAVPETNVPSESASPESASAAAPASASGLTEADFIDAISGLGESSAPLSSSVPAFQPAIPDA